jgi:starch synthase
VRPLRILILAAEVAPFAKTGGLADVAAALTRYLASHGHDVKLVMPFYGRVKSGRWRFEQHPRLQGMKLTFGARTLGFSVCTTKLPKSTADVFFLQSDELFAREGIYTWDRDEHLRFGLLARAAMEICQWLEWSPDVIHCNDWHTALAPLYLKAAYAWDRLFEPTRTVLTIHNIGYQGVFPVDTLHELGFGTHAHLLHQGDLAAGKLNFLKTGVIYADALTTVSETYAQSDAGLRRLGWPSSLRARRRGHGHRQRRRLRVGPDPRRQDPAALLGERPAREADLPRAAPRAHAARAFRDRAGVRHGLAPDRAKGLRAPARGPAGPPARGRAPVRPRQR